MKVYFVGSSAETLSTNTYSFPKPWQRYYCLQAKMPFFLVYFWKYMTTPPKVYFRDILLQHYLYYFPIKAAKVAPLNWNHHSQNPCEKATFFCPPTPLKSFSIRRGQLILGNRFIFFIPWTIKQEADVETFVNKVCAENFELFACI